MAGPDASPGRPRPRTVRLPRPGLFALLCAAACAAPPYAPCPIELDGPLPADAFERCKRALADRYGSLVVADADGFRLQTGWLPANEPPCERRATVFLAADGPCVVVECRRLSEPLVGLPQWSAARGDPAAERALAELLRERLSLPR